MEAVAALSQWAPLPKPSRGRLKRDLFIYAHQLAFEGVGSASLHSDNDMHRHNRGCRASGAVFSCGIISDSMASARCGRHPCGVRRCLARGSREGLVYLRLPRAVASVRRGARAVLALLVLSSYRVMRHYEHLPLITKLADRLAIHMPGIWVACEFSTNW